MRMSKISFWKICANIDYFPLSVIRRIWYDIKIKFIF